MFRGHGVTGFNPPGILHTRGVFYRSVRPSRRFPNGRSSYSALIVRYPFTQTGYERIRLTFLQNRRIIVGTRYARESESGSSMLRKRQMNVSENIIRRCVEGDQAAFRALVEAHQSYAYALAVRMLFNAEDAKDVVQEAFIRVWKHLHRFNPQNKFTTWLYRIVTNLCYDRIKAKKRSIRKIRSIQSQDAGEDVKGEDVEQRVQSEEMMQIIQKITETLHPKQHIVFTLRDLQDLSIEGTARVACMTPGAVKSNLYYARRHIRKYLERMGYGGDSDHGM